MNKIKTLFVVTIILFSTNLLAQYHVRERVNHQSENDSTYGFDKNKMFIGGNINLGIGGGYSTSYVIGISPEIGYTFKQWLDAGIALKYNYYSVDENTQYQYYGINYSEYGAGIFIRGHITDGFFLQVQPEFTLYRGKKFYTPTNENYKIAEGTSGVLAGIGYGERVVGEMSYYTTIMINISGSEYAKTQGGGIIPIIKTGFVFYLGRNKNRRRY